MSLVSHNAVTGAARDANLVVTAELVACRLLCNLLQQAEALLGTDGRVLHPVDKLVQLPLQVA